MDVKAFAANYIQGELAKSRILIVDDDATVLKVFSMLLKQGGFEHVQTTTDPHQARHLYLSFRPDVVILDLNMPGLDGLEVMKQLTACELDSFVPILVLTGETDSRAKIKALTSGARDFMEKPFVPVEAVARVRNLLEVSLLRRRIQQENLGLEEEVLRRTLEVRDSQFEMAQRLSLAAEYREDSSGLSARRISLYCLELAPRCGMPDYLCQLLGQASALHDLGMIGVPDAILFKKGRLAPSEWNAMTAHVQIGLRILSGGSSPLLKLAEEVVRTHHERWDGTGYPSQLKGEEIPLSGRLVALCDSFEALTSERPYRHAWSVEAAATEIELSKGSQFDPRLTDLFLGSLPQLIAIREKLG